jgi:hypothetical protein
MAPGVNPILTLGTKSQNLGLRRRATKRENILLPRPLNLGGISNGCPIR